MKFSNKVISAFLSLAIAASMVVPAFAAGETVKVNDLLIGWYNLFEIRNVEKTGVFCDEKIYYSSAPVIKFNSAVDEHGIEYMGQGSTVNDLENLVNNSLLKPEIITVKAETKLTKPGIYSIWGIEGDDEYMASAYLIVTAGAAPIANNLTAIPTVSNVVVDGVDVKFDAYNINGSNYFKLRDVAYMLNGTEKQFDVTWVSTKKVIELISDSTYTEIGGEMVGGDGNKKSATPTSAPIMLYGRMVDWTAYTINNNNYFKLRDLGQALDFSVKWDGGTNTIYIDTSWYYGY
ncbi:MAG: hypothetical protein K0Q87_4700 [Neobacillus sp.]|nr:hypothetical protein [Neobacillus sp.]